MLIQKSEERERESKFEKNEEGEEGEQNKKAFSSCGSHFLANLHGSFYIPETKKYSVVFE